MTAGFRAPSSSGHGTFHLTYHVTICHNTNMISFDEFKKVEIKVAKVLEAERVEGSDKLLKLKTSLGSEERQIVSGIGKVYEPADMVGKNIVIVANLEPRQIMGLESQGMILAASDDSGPAILIPDREIPPGTEVR